MVPLIALSSGNQTASATSPEDAIRQLYDAYAEDVARWTRFQGFSPADVEDTVQDVFLVAYRRWSEFRQEASPRTWLYQITKNVAMNKRRGIRRLFALRQAASVEPQRRTASSTAEDLEGVDLVFSLLNQLPYKHREAVWLHDFEDMRAQEIAGIVDVSPNTVWTRINRGRARLRQLAESLGVDAPNEAPTGPSWKEDV